MAIVYAFQCSMYPSYVLYVCLVCYTKSASQSCSVCTGACFAFSLSGEQAHPSETISLHGDRPAFH